MFDKEKIDLIIKNNWNSESQNSIAWGLNAQNFTTQKGKKWTQASVSYYALNVLNLERKHKEFTKNSIAQKVESVLTPEVKTEKLTEVKELNPLQTAYKNHVEEVNKTALIETAVFEKQGKFFTDSLKIAQIFDKEHKDVLEAIRNCKVSNNFRSAEFSADVYFDNFNRQQPKINLTKKGFSFVAFGFTGEKADEFKEKFINRFEELEKLAEQPKLILYTNELDIIIASANQIKVIAERQIEFEKITNNKYSSLENKVNNIIVNFPRKRNYNPEPVHQDTLFEIEKAVSYKDKTFKKVKAYSVHVNRPENTIFNTIYAIFDDVYNMNIKKDCSIHNLRAKTKFSTLAYIELIGMDKALWEIAENNLIFNTQKLANHG